MPELLPFIGTRYNSERVKLSEVVAPPYDVISESEREVFYERDAHNVIRLILNHDANPYKSAAAFLERWLSEGVLKREAENAFYVYYQRFQLPSGQTVTRSSVIGRLKLSAYSEGKVLPHEQTMPGPKRDRLQLMEATHANLSPIFGLIDDPIHLFDHTLEVATAYPPIADIDEKLPTGATVRHLLWKLDDAAAISRIETIVGNQPMTIADGHHRYETALAFHEVHPEIAASQYMMVCIANLRGEGTVILPTHRALHGVKGFDQYKFLEQLRKRFEPVEQASREGGYKNLEADPEAITLIEFGDEPRYILVRSTADKEGTALQRLAVVRLHDEILKPIVGLSQAAIDAKTNLLYPHTLNELDEMKAKNEIQAAFLLKPVSPEEMAAVVLEGAFMPQKSTFFYPKLLSGLVFHEFGAQRA